MGAVRTPLPMGRRPATALIAYLRDLTMEEPVDRGEIATLVQVVSLDQAERIAFLSGLRAANSSEIATAAADVLDEHAATLREQEARLSDMDEVVGAWAQRVSVGALVAFAGAAVSGVLPVAAAGLALGCAAVGGVAVALVRIRSRGRRSTLARRRDAADSLARRAEAARRTDASG